MDLSDDDIKLLGTIRKRSRVAKAVIAIFALKGLLLIGVAAWFAIESCSPTLILDQQDPFWALQMLVRQQHQSAAGFFGVCALLNLSICLFTWIQRKSDGLILKLVDRASGYPPSSL